MPGLEFVVPGARAHCNITLKRKQTPPKKQRERTSVHDILGEAGPNSMARQ